MPRWPVSHQDGIYQVADRDGLLYPITRMGEPVRELLPGWYPTGLQTGLPPFHLLELRNDTLGGEDAVWYLTEELEFITHTVAHFGKEQIDLVVEQMSPLLRDIYEQGICAERSAVAASSHAFDGINGYGIRELVSVVVETALSPPEVVQADHLEQAVARSTSAGLGLSAGLVRHSLDITLPETPRGSVRLASPFDASLLAAQEAYAPDGGVLTQVYRFHDPAAPAALYLLGWHDTRPALYIPAVNTIFTYEDGLSGADVMTTLLCHQAMRSAFEAPAPSSPEPPAKAGEHASPSTTWWKRVFGLGHA